MHPSHRGSAGKEFPVTTVELRQLVGATNHDRHMTGVAGVRTITYALRG